MEGTSQRRALTLFVEGTTEITVTRRRLALFEFAYSWPWGAVHQHLCASKPSAGALAVIVGFFCSYERHIDPLRVSIDCQYRVETRAISSHPCKDALLEFFHRKRRRRKIKVTIWIVGVRIT